MSHLFARKTRISYQSELQIIVLLSYNIPRATVIYKNHEVRPQRTKFLKIPEWVV